MSEVRYSPNYRPMPDARRNGWVYYLTHCESAYTPEEIKFREFVLRLRSASQIDLELLQTDNNWFSSNDEIAFFTIHEGSWFLAPLPHPRQNIDRENFYIGLQSQRPAKWTSLLSMTRSIGDYLLLRNKQLSEDHLNQPMNYVLLDLIQILNRLAYIDESQFVNKQLRYISQYLRKIEIQVDPAFGSDRLFLTEFREIMINEVQTEINQKLQTSLLKNQIEQIQHQLNQIGELRHTVLHFSLTAERVNPHPYWEKFSNPGDSILNSPSFPTLSATICAQKNQDAIQVKSQKQNSALTFDLPPITLQTLQQCQQFKFNERASPEAKAAYIQALQDLQKLVHFQGVLKQLSELINRAGEVITLVKFRQPIQQLLLEIGQFVRESEQNLLHTMRINTNLYYQLIQKQQDLNLWDKFFTNTQRNIQNFLENQDNLARYPVSEQEIQEPDINLLDQIEQTISYLRQQANEMQNTQLLSSTQLLLDDFLNNVGLSAVPNAPEKLIEQKQNTLAIKETNFSQFNASDYQQIHIHPPQLSSGYTEFGFFNQQNNRVTANLNTTVMPTPYLSLFLLLPFGILGLQWLYHKAISAYGRSQQSNERSPRVFE